MSQTQIQTGTVSVTSDGDIPTGTTRTLSVQVLGLVAGQSVALTPPADIKDSIILDGYVQPDNVLNVRATNANGASDIDPGGMVVGYLAVR